MLFQAMADTSQFYFEGGDTRLPTYNHLLVVEILLLQNKTRRKNA